MTDLGARPTPGLGAGPANGLVGGRGVGPAGRASFDLNLRSTLGLRVRRGRSEARRSPIARRWLRLRSHLWQALDRRRYVALGLPGWLALGRPTWVGRRPGRTVPGLTTRHVSGAGWSRGRRRLAIPHRGRRACRAARTGVAVARSRRRLRTRAVSGGLAARRRCHGLGGRLRNERPGHRRGRSGPGGTTVVAWLSVLPRVRPWGIGRFWLIWLEAPGAGGGVSRSVHACSLVWPPGGRRAQPIGAGALPRRLSTTCAGPIPPTAAEG
jgi:hypothetical protein